ncbi:hypothetical protein [Streptomyces sp. NPDC092952]|uniref:hypothetical protein n=1 Tax=Streptomyces sp. NPDC092952 TaxID=3366018 RepID=UPI0038059300
MTSTIKILSTLLVLSIGAISALVAAFVAISCGRPAWDVASAAGTTFVFTATFALAVLGYLTRPA